MIRSSPLYTQAVCKFGFPVSYALGAKCLGRSNVDNTVRVIVHERVDDGELK